MSPCNVILDGTGRVGIIACSRGRRRKAKPCEMCGAASSLLCDGPGRSPGKTCDMPLCQKCATHTGPDTDLCPEHAAQRPLLMPTPVRP